MRLRRTSLGAVGEALPPLRERVAESRCCSHWCACAGLVAKVAAGCQPGGREVVVFTELSLNPALTFEAVQSFVFAACGSPGLMLPLLTPARARW